MEYTNAEVEVIIWLNNYLKSKEDRLINIQHKYRYNYNNNQHIELDGFGDGFAVEIYLASDLKGAKIDKVASDILKLTLLPKDIKRLFVCREEVKNRLQGKSWLSYAIIQNSIEIIVPKFTEETLGNLIIANKRNRESILRM
ncbi:hypothetical protein B8V81_2960 [Paenibacillus pasadenensis]|uniref:Uncharacterized protein n=2 Tax=Paenibacillus pasadenensis TaxID=217090 RepID=A0A2N5N2H7_9BACL|nr:hypothetical protein B8V81_2960 [Paenibacillus pasadenensis]